MSTVKKKIAWHEEKLYIGKKQNISASQGRVEGSLEIQEWKPNEHMAKRQRVRSRRPLGLEIGKFNASD